MGLPRKNGQPDVDETVDGIGTNIYNYYPTTNGVLGAVISRSVSGAGTGMLEGVDDGCLGEQSGWQWLPEYASSIPAQRHSGGGAVKRTIGKRFNQIDARKSDESGSAFPDWPR